MSNKEKHILYFDGDVVIYRAGFGAEQRIVETDDEGYKVSRIEVAPVDHAIQNLKEIVEYSLFECNTDDYKFFISGGGNFRKEIATIREYKGNRKRQRQPIHYQELKRYICENHPFEIVEGQEADDALGIHLTESGNRGIVVSNDKDLLMVPGKHFNPVKGVKTLVSYTEGELTFWTQLLSGDSTDNIMGCPGIGTKKAQKALDGISNPHAFWKATKQLYKKQLNSKAAPEGIYMEGDTVIYPSYGHGAEIEKTLDDFIIENARLLWIRRQHGELWAPPLGD